MEINTKELVEQATVERNRGRTINAITLYKEAIQDEEKKIEPDQRTILHCNHMIGVALNMEGDPRASSVFKKLLDSPSKYLEEIKPGVLRDYATSLARVGKTQEAEQHWLESLRLSQERDDNTSAAITAGKLGRFYCDHEDFPQGGAYLGLAMQLLKQQKPIDQFSLLTINLLCAYHAIVINEDKAAEQYLSACEPDPTWLWRRAELAGHWAVLHLKTANFQEFVAKMIEFWQIVHAIKPSQGSLSVLYKNSALAEIMPFYPRQVSL